VRPPAVGTPVQVRWVDGNLYSAVFKGINDTSLVEVQHSGFHSWLMIHNICLLFDVIGFS